VTGFRDAFAAALLAPVPPASPAGLDGEAARRFRIWRNNVHAALTGALADAYPVVARLVGEAFFAATAREFVRAHPPRTSVLALYGAGFAEFLEGFPPAATLPYLPDVARLERACLEAMHAADAPPLDPASLAAAGDRLADMRFRPHPAARLVRSAHPVVSIRAANQGDAPRARAEIAARPEAALVTRPALEVRVDALAPGAAAFADRLLAGDPAGAAWEAAAAADPGFDPADAFRRLLTAGAFASVLDDTPTGGPPCPPSAA